MKTLKNYLFIAVLISLTFPAICQEDPGAKNGSPTYLNSNMTVIDGLYKAFAVGDIPAVLGGLDSNVVWNEAEGNFYADGNPYLGPDAVLNGVFGRIMADHEYFNLKDIVLHEMSNDKVLATLRYDGKFKNGNSYDAQVAHLWSLKDGKVVSFQQYVDTKKLHEAMTK
ncbi:nuclear transport factor 2 family protein [Algoriphagus sp.]|uniref:nuclear transport factor 2 family protein n=1 Tax=Algoriphagus sp. TaxID=1872435 RepID=UPI0039194960